MIKLQIKHSKGSKGKGKKCACSLKFVVITLEIIEILKEVAVGI